MGWDVGPDSHSVAGRGGCEGADHLGRERRLHGLQDPSARRRGVEKGDLQKEPPGGVFLEPADHGLGRSRGGLTSKIHLAVEQGQKPLSVVITAGQPVMPAGSSPSALIAAARRSRPRARRETPPLMRRPLDLRHVISPSLWDLIELANTHDLDRVTELRAVRRIM